jgi:hypothetical protein
MALPHNPIEDSMTIDPVPMPGQLHAPTKLLQVYVDNFCYAATQSVDEVHIPTIGQAQQFMASMLSFPHLRH